MSVFYKVLLVGEPGVGKTTFINRLLSDPQPTKPSLGLEVHPVRYKDVIISFWVINQTLSPKYYEDADAVIIMVDATKKDAILVENWYAETYTTRPMFLVGNKADFPRTATNTQSVMPYFDLSAKTGYNVGALMDRLVASFAEPSDTESMED